MGKFKRKKKELKIKKVKIQTKVTFEEEEEKKRFSRIEGFNSINNTAYWQCREEKLFYNENTMKQVSELAKILERKNFQRIVNRARAKRGNLPFIVLLHGPSGTGKTALVKEICRQTKRHLLEIIVEKLRNENCGQDEKATKMVFEDYMCASSILEEYPILFFDECEAHLCKRMSTDGFNSTMINHLNNMTTIWLKHFQEFDGILFLATNRKEDFDEAFARRILYQIEIDYPTKEIQAAIWENYFPKVLTSEQCKSLAEEMNFTGGQIKQVQTKADIHELIYGKIDYNIIHDICETNWKAVSERKRIGFSR